MGLLDVFWRPCVCPLCRQKGAKQFKGRVKCPNMNCTNYDSGTAQAASPSMGEGSPAALDLSAFSGNFDPGTNRIEIRYRNYCGEEQAYHGDRRTLRRRKQHISICLVPTGRRATFALQWVLSPTGLGDVAETTEAQGPSPAERRVLAFHMKRNSTSALYEKLRSKYPDYSKP